MMLVLLLLAQPMNLNKAPPQRVTGLDGGAVHTVLPMTQSGAFGEVLGVQATPVVSVAFPYNFISTEQLLTLTDAGSVTADGGHAIMTVGATGYSEIRSRLAARYVPGQGMMARFTFVNSRACTAGVETLVGAGDDDDNFGFGCCRTCSSDGGSTFGVLRRTNSVDYWTPASAWNGVWGTTPPDTTYGRPYQIQWQWLGYGQVTYSIEDTTTGGFVTAHAIKYAGTATETSIANPTLPAHAHVITSGADGGFVLRVPSMGLFRQGAAPQNGGLRRSQSGSISTSTTEKAVLAVRDNTTFNGRPNRTQISAELLTYSAGTPAGADITVRLRLNPGTTGSNFVNVSASNSCASYDISATLAPDGFLGNGVEWLSFIVTGGTSGLLDLSHYDLHLAPGDVLQVTGQSSSGTPTLRVSLSWTEDY